MASSFNLIRDSRVFFTTNVDAYGVVNSTGFLSGAYGTGNTWEIQVQDGFTFSQNTTTETVTLNEAGATPNRGQRNFNTALEPVDFSFSTYMRPRDAGTNIDAEEGVLWNAMFSNASVGTTGSGNTGAAWVPGTSSAICSLTYSGNHQLQQFGLIIVLGGTTFVIDNCVMDSATIDFGLDAIASIAWAGKGSTLRQLTNAPTVATNTTTGIVTFTSGGTNSIAGTANWKNISAPYLANKLSTVALDSGIGVGGTAYTVAITGGNLTFANNVTYLTPANLGVVNKPIQYFTGTRAIGGTINAYLRSGAGLTAALLKSLLDGSSTTVDPAYYMKLSIGGNASAGTRVDIEMPAVMLTIPTVATEQVVSTTITFTAQGSASSAFDIEQVNEATITYVAPQVA
jgi:hypothetical protein